MLRGLRFAKLTGRGKGSSRNVRHDQPVRHPRLEMHEYAGLSSRHADRERGSTAKAKPRRVRNPAGLCHSDAEGH